MTNEKIILQLKKGYDVKNPQLAQVLSNLEDIGTTVSDDVAESIKTAECIIVDNLTGYNFPIIYTRSDYTNTRRWFCALRNVNTIATFDCNFNTNSLTQITLLTVSDFLLNSNSFINSLKTKLGLDA